MSEDVIERGVELLSKFEDGAVDLATKLDRLETVTTDPHVTRTVLDTAEKRGIIERENGRLRVLSGEYVSYESDVITKDGEFTCRR